jgi:hypothetical protein
MTPDETSFFQLLDAYARTRHRCFLAEMTLRTKELGYWMCFRPIGGSEDSSSRYACKYLMVPTEHIKAAGSRQQLPTSLVDQLDAELSELKKVI